MTATQITDGLHKISADCANLCLIEAPEGLTLVDTGFAKSEAKIIAAIRGLATPRRVCATSLSRMPAWTMSAASARYSGAT